jgi:GNAT superfamily N-acetyltransferase
LAGIADAVQGAAGLAHRQAVVADDPGGERLAGEVRPLGWQVERRVLMALRRGPDRPSPPVTLGEVGLEWKRAFAHRYLSEDAEDLDAATVEQLDSRDELVAAAGGRIFGVEVDGEPAASCDLYVGGDVAQIENVVTRAPYRGRGLARALVLAGAETARAEGRELSFLVADEDDWVPALYERLGFDPIGRTWLLRRTPESSGPA